MVEGTPRDAPAVDDDADIRAAIRLALEEDGYQVAEAANGLNALTFFRQLPACLVIVSDDMMPYMKGAALLRAAMKEQGKDCHEFVFVSAKSHMFSPEFATQARELGAR
jgi:CheY-like chemotaxis protein